MKVYAGMAPHVVLLARVGEEVGLRASLDAGIEERQTVLRHNGIVVVARDNLQTALQVLGLVDEARLGVALGVLRSPYMTSYHFQSMTGPPATPTLNTSG